MKRFAGWIRRQAERVEKFETYYRRGETDYDFLVRIAERPSWHRHRKRLLRIADKIREP